MLARETVRPLLGWLAFGAAMCLLPLFASTGTVRMLIFAHFLAMFAMSWDIISGRTGYISFGHPFLIGLAAYTTGMLTYHLDTPLWLSIPAVVLVTMAGGTLFFLPALRIRGTYFALVTLAFMELMYQLTQVVAPKITGGTRGLSGIPTLVSGAVPNYYLTFGVMFAIGIGLWRLVMETPPAEAEREIVRSVGFSDKEAEMLPGQLSMGDLRRLELARTLATGPEVLLLDEVFAGLTVGEIAQISELLLARKRDGMTCIIVSHDLRSLAPLVDRVVVMSFGASIAAGTLDEVLADTGVRDAYLGTP